MPKMIYEPKFNSSDQVKINQKELEVGDIVIVGDVQNCTQIVQVIIDEEGNRFTL